MKLIKYTFLAIALFCFAFSGLNAQSNSEKGDVNIQVINLDNGQTVDKPLIGIMLSIEHEIEELNGQRKESSTLMVDGFVENGFAEKSGLQVGDVVKTVNGSEVNDYDDLGNALSGKKAGESVAVGVLRNGENLNYSVQLMSRPAQLAAKSSCSYDANSRGKCCPGTKWECDWDEVCEMPGRAVMGVIIEDTEAGVFVKDLSEGGAAQSAGVHAGDVIVRFNKEDIETTDGLIGIMKNYKVGDEVKIKYLRDGKKKSAKMVLKESKSKNRANCDMSKCDMSKCPSKNADTVDEKYDLICEKDNIKVVKLREGDVEKLVKGEEINLRLPGKSAVD